jgi:uncharacterized membrane protein
MEQRPGRWTDEQVDRVMGRLLQVGVILSALVVLGGGVLYLVRHGEERVDLHEFRREPAELRTPHGVVQDALSGSARGVIQLGLLLLIATPVARVAFSVYAFLRQRDRTYVLITLLVLAVLVWGLWSGQ